MRKATTLLAMAGALMAGVPDEVSHSGQKKYPSGGGQTSHGHYTPGEFKRRKAAKRAENQARNRQH